MSKTRFALAATVMMSMSLGALSTAAEARSLRCDQAYDRYDNAINALAIATVKACPRGFNRAPRTPAIVAAMKRVNAANVEYRRACGIR